MVDKLFEVHLQAGNDDIFGPIMKVSVRPLSASIPLPKDLSRFLVNTIQDFLGDSFSNTVGRKENWFYIEIPFIVVEKYGPERVGHAIVQAVKKAYKVYLDNKALTEMVKNVVKADLEEIAEVK